MAALRNFIDVVSQSPIASAVAAVAVEGVTRHPGVLPETFTLLHLDNQEPFPTKPTPCKLYLHKLSFFTLL